MVDAARIAHIQAFLGTKSMIDAISSTIPDPILHRGSIQSFEKSSTDSGAAQNLKGRVCNRM